MSPLKHLAALVHRSFCPLTRITFDLHIDDDWDQFDDLQPLLGITDLVVEYLEEIDHVVNIKTLLLEEYFPDLRRLTLRLNSFLFLWDEGVISLVLDHKRSRLDAANEGRQFKNFVIEPDRTEEFDVIWSSYRRNELEKMQLNITSREDGFEISIP